MNKVYVFEKGFIMPLCACLDSDYINPITGEAITNEGTLNFIKNGLKRKSLHLAKADIRISAIYEKNGLYFVGYRYDINDRPNFLDHRKNLFKEYDRKWITEKLAKGEFIERILWQ